MSYVSDTFTNSPSKPYTQAMCPRCSEMEGAFGSRDPLPPNIASLDLDPPITDASERRDSPSRSKYQENIEHTGNTIGSDELSLQPQEDKLIALSGVSESVSEGKKSELSVLAHETIPSAGVKTGAQVHHSPCHDRNSVDKTPTLEASEDDHLGHTAAAAAAESSPPPEAESSSSATSPVSQPRNHIFTHSPHHSPTTLVLPYTATSCKSGSHTSAKWSDVVAFGSKPGRQKDFTAHTGPNILASIMKHPDILHTLMLNCPDFLTLFALVTSCKTAKRAFEHYPQGVIKAMLSRLPQELQHLTIALIGINGSNLRRYGAIKDLMETWLGKGPKPLAKRLRVCTWESNTSPFGASYYTQILSSTRSGHRLASVLRRCPAIFGLRLPLFSIRSLITLQLPYIPSCF